VLNCISGRLRPGTACLILGPPGAGSSSLLRLLSGRLQPSSVMLLGGQLTYNGRSAGQLKALDGVELRKLAAYSPEDDEHEFLLTVRETFDFAYKAAVLPPPAEAAAAAAAPPPAAASTGGGSSAFSFPAGRWTPPDADVMCNIMVRPLQRALVSAAVRAKPPHNTA
jgi:energy-coupling factor transporter ATP-binding protein EcfA2